MKPEIVIVGLGPGPLGLLTKEAEGLLASAGRVFFRTKHHPVYEWLQGEGKKLISFDIAYEKLNSCGRVYDFIAETMVREARRSGLAVLALPGSPFVMEDTPHLVISKARRSGIATRVVPGMSFLEVLYTVLEMDPCWGLQIVHPNHLQELDFSASSRMSVLIGMVGTPFPFPTSPGTNTSSVVRRLLEFYPPQHQVTLVWTGGSPDFSTVAKAMPLDSVADHIPAGFFMGSLLVPPLPP